MLCASVLPGPGFTQPTGLSPYDLCPGLHCSWAGFQAPSPPYTDLPTLILALKTSCLFRNLN